MSRRWYSESEVQFTVTCSECGTAVVDRSDHDQWHDKVEREFRQALAVLDTR